MNAEKERLMAWEPNSTGYSHDQMILAVGLQCRDKQFPVTEVLQWLGPPHKSWGNTLAGQLAYLYSDPAAEVFPMFDVAEGKTVGFGVVSRFTDNTKRTDPVSGEEILFNCLDEMEPFNETAFTKETQQCT